MNQDITTPGVTAAATLGVLGGMGPMATADFLNKLVLATSATCDQEHLATIVYSVPQIPDRTAAILHDTASPFPEMLRGLRVLERSGATAVAIPCNTAHFWHERLQLETTLPIFHIVEAVLSRLSAIGISGDRIGLLATTGTVRAGVYPSRLATAGYECIVPDPEDQEQLVMDGIRRVKAGDLSGGRELLKTAAEQLADRGATAIILGCTEIPLVLNTERDFFIDPTRALAESCALWWADRRWTTGTATLIASSDTEASIAA